MKIAFTTTTIHVPEFLGDYVLDAKKHGVAIDIIVAGDKKTPAACASYCENLAALHNVPVLYSGAAHQQHYLKSFPELDAFLPWNCVQRRNLAVLMAYQAGADIIVLMDDDNFIAQDNYFAGYAHVGKTTRVPAISSASGWYNICETLREAQDRRFYPRGYPVSQRSMDAPVTEEQAQGRVVVNAGLWLGDPDIDAVTRLAAPIDVTAYKRTGHFALSAGTWAPFNSQNTAIARECVPAYFLCPNIGRFDDIWASYVVKRIADHLGDTISFGEPLVRQNRNPHDLWADVDLERMGMQLTDEFCNWLRAIPLNAASYGACAAELMHGLEAKLHAASLSAEARAYIARFIDGYRVWEKTLARLGISATEQSAA